MMKSLVTAAVLSCGLTGYALAQATVTGAPEGTAPVTAEPMPHHHHHWHHHYWHHHHHMHEMAAPAAPAPAPGAPAPSPGSCSGSARAITGTRRTLAKSVGEGRTSGPRSPHTTACCGMSL